jgi:modulator of FtsH protease HflK
MASVRAKTPWSLALVRRGRRRLHRAGRWARQRWGWLVSGLGLAVLLWQSLYTVANGESVAVLRWGRLVDDAVGPGLHLRLPLGIDQLNRFRTGEVSRLPVEGERAPGFDLMTRDENLVEARLVAQLRVHRLGRYLYGSEDPQALVRQVVRAALTQVVTEVGVEELLTSAKAMVQNEVRQRAQARLDHYDVGVTLVSVTLQSLDPPGEASAAFRDVTDARSEAAQRVAQADGERERSLRLARGETSQLLSAAEAWADSARNRAQGRSDRFGQLVTASRAAGGGALLRTELAAGTVRAVMGKARVIVLPPGQSGALDLQLLDHGLSPPRPGSGNSTTRVPQSPPDGDGEH